MIKIIKNISPPANWRFLVIVTLGVLTGLFIYILKISKAASYLSDESETCINCHIMAPQYATWNHSSHREWASCNDCHVPHNNVLNKYYFKAMDGMRHATIFTLRNEPQVIQIREAGIEVVQNNCVRCHINLITDSKLLNYNQVADHNRKDRLCWSCHREVPHGRVNSISSVPNAQVPRPSSLVPEWIKK